MTTPEEKTIDDLVADLVKESLGAPGRPIELTDSGWKFGLNRVREGYWVVSAMTFPRGRAPTEQDWERLGKVVPLIYHATDPTRDPPAADTLEKPIDTEDTYGDDRAQYVIRHYNSAEWQEIPTCSGKPIDTEDPYATHCWRWKYETETDE